MCLPHCLILEIKPARVKAVISRFVGSATVRYHVVSEIAVPVVAQHEIWKGKLNGHNYQTITIWQSVSVWIAVVDLGERSELVVQSLTQANGSYEVFVQIKRLLMEAVT